LKNAAWKKFSGSFFYKRDPQLSWLIYALSISMCRRRKIPPLRELDENLPVIENRQNSFWGEVR
jgi:hypothetical protein